jgi:uncharacterized lipoprotein NlpE involved in copper resistance
MRIFKITKTMIFLLGLSILLALPLSLAQDTNSDSTVPPGEAYTVQANDWLSKLAEQYLGNVLAYDLIVQATNAKAAEDDSFARIENPDLIEVGQQLWIPTLDETAESDTSQPTPAPTPAPTDNVVGIYKSVLPSAGCCGQDLTLFLNVDNTARLDTDFHNGEPPIVEVGSWAINEAGQVELTLTGQVDRAYDSPAVHLFEQAETGLTRAANPEAPEAILETYYPFFDLALGEAMFRYDRFAVEQSTASNGFAGIYKAFLPSASCCGQDISLYLNVDGTANLQTDYLNGEAPITESGSWNLNPAGEVVVTLNGGLQVLVLEFSDSVLKSTAETTVYGSEGIRFYNLSGFVIALLPGS